jgi:hypothetical protein
MMVMTIALATSCDLSCPKSDRAALRSNLAGHELLALVLSPASATLSAGAFQHFTVSGEWGDGASTAPSVTFSATGGTITAGGLYTAGSTAGSFRVIATQQGGTLADTAPVTVTGGSSPLAGDLRVEVMGVPAGQDKWLLEDTDTVPAAGKGCPSDSVTRFNEASAPIVIPTSGCKTELSVFAVGNAPVLDLTPAPHSAFGQSVITETLPARWTVMLHVVTEYDVPPEGDPKSPKSEAALASAVFDANRMGIEFVVDGPVQAIDPSTDPLAADVRSGCNAFKGATTSNKVAKHLNVFYLRDDQKNPEWYVLPYWGFDCVDSGVPEVIFIRQIHLTMTLAHEIGHALSLKHAGASMNFAYYGWIESNLMRNGIWDPTIGQAYRANFNTGSWLNSSGLRGEPSKTCQTIEVNQRPDSPTRPPDWPCPLLQLDWPP